MSKRLAPYGQENYAGTIATVGNIKGAHRNATRLPSGDVPSDLGAGSATDARRLVRLKAG